METYRKRIADNLLVRKLATSGAVLVEGPKWCGKTTTAERAAASVLYMDEPKKKAQNVLLAKTSPDELLAGAAPRLIDEWQLAPELWDAVRFSTDHSGGFGRFILTGSAVPADSEAMSHSGTGRFSWLRMRPMTLWESGDSSGGLPLSALFDGTAPDAARARPHELAAVAGLVCRGGWPQAIGLEGDLACDPSRNYVDAVTKKDISRVDGVARDEDRARRLLRSYARLQGTQASASVIREDLASNEMVSFDDDTVYSYLNALRKIFVVEDLPAWCPNLRSKDAVRTSDTRYFVDPSIATAALGAGPRDLMGDLATFGLLFETMAVRDLRVYMEALDGETRHYRDKSGLECDAVLHRRDGRYGLAEIKLGGDALVEEGVASLSALAKLIAAKKMPQPVFRMVVTAVGDFAYRRPDGIWVCPLSSLKP